MNGAGFQGKIHRPLIVGKPDRRRLEIPRQGQLTAIDGDIEIGGYQVVMADAERQVDQEIALRRDGDICDAALHHLFGTHETGQIQFEGFDGFTDRQVDPVQGALGNFRHQRVARLGKGHLLRQAQECARPNFEGRTPEMKGAQ